MPGSVALRKTTCGSRGLVHFPYKVVGWHDVVGQFRSANGSCPAERREAGASDFPPALNKRGAAATTSHKYPESLLVKLEAGTNARIDDTLERFEARSHMVRQAIERESVENRGQKNNRTQAR